MKAATYYAAGDIRVEDIPDPQMPGPGEIIVRVRACGVCGSDVSAWYMDRKAPVVLGHEPAGDVEAVGAGVTDFAVGDRVALHHHVPCMVCDVCRRGHETLCEQFRSTRLYPAGMAELVRVPAEIVRSDVLKLPDHLPYDAGALVEPVACCVRALDRADMQNGDTVVVIGAGFNGVVMAMLAPLWGAYRTAVLDLNPVRLKRARKLGLTAFDAGTDDIKDQIADWADGKGPHAVIVTPYAIPVIEFGFQLAAPGATLLMYGPPSPDTPWPLDVNRVFFKEITVKGTYSAGPSDIKRTLSLFDNGLLKVDDLVTHRFSLDDAGEAWQVTKDANDSLKVIVEL